MTGRCSTLVRMIQTGIIASTQVAKYTSLPIDLPFGFPIYLLTEAVRNVRVSSSNSSVNILGTII